MKSLAVAWLLASIAACTAPTYPAHDPTRGTEEKVYLDTLPRSVLRKDLHRYTCPGEQPPMCQCTGRVGLHCDCSCFP